MKVPTLYEWAGGAEALRRLTEVFYDRVLADEMLAPVFARMSEHHREHVAIWLGEVFGGRRRYTDEFGGYRAMLSHHLDLGLTEQQRSRWAALIAASADKAGLPTDPEFRSAFVAYVEWAPGSPSPTPSPARHRPPKHRSRTGAGARPRPTSPELIATCDRRTHD